MTTILDYGLGNLRSVEKAILSLGYKAQISEEVPTFSEHENKLIIPGVGAFGAAMERLVEKKEAIQNFAKEGGHIFGICLGQQLLFSESEEHGHHTGLGLLQGSVKYFPADLGVKIPLIGWSPLSVKPGKQILNGISNGDQVYFVHSLHTVCADSADIAATANHGMEFVASVQRDRIWGCQFHPEKSSAIGLQILKNFLLC